MEFLGRIAYEAVRIRPLLPTYLHLLISALFPIYTGAHASLSRPSSAALPEKKKHAKAEAGDGGDEDDESVVQKMEGLSPSDAITFPLLAGATLASLYFLLQWLKDPDILNRILGYYFALIGLTFGVKFVKDAFSVGRSILLPTQYTANGGLWRADNLSQCYEASSTRSSSTRVHQSSPLPGLLRSIPLPRTVSKWLWRLRESLYAKASLKLHLHKMVTLKCPVDFLDLASLIITTGVIVYHTFVEKPWWLTNFLGFSFCYGSLQFMSPTTSWTGTLILSALFFYDIYFVFFTPMMVTVATKLDIPIKLLFPRPDGCALPIGAVEGSALMEEYLECLAKKRTMAMLGLGDIVIPGMMIAFALRYDLYIFYLRQVKEKETGKEAESAEVSTDPTSKFVKAKYISAAGGWGERLWTSRKFESAELKAKHFPKPYFYASLVGYVLGMIMTLVVMQIAEHAQPALLYLVPGVLISLWGTAMVKGDLKLMWEYSEAAEEEDAKEKESKENDSETKQAKKDAKEVKGKDKAISKVDSCRDLVSFSITLPALQLKALKDRSEDTTVSDSEKITIDLADAMNGNVSGQPRANASASLPDIEADHAVLHKSEKSLTDEGDDRSPAEKRRRKA